MNRPKRKLQKVNYELGDEESSDEQSEIDDRQGSRPGRRLPEIVPLKASFKGILGFHHHKGGVSKTTTAANLIRLLQSGFDEVEHEYKSICVIDCDSQMSLTSAFIGLEDMKLELERQLNNFNLMETSHDVIEACDVPGILYNMMDHSTSLTDQDKWHFDISLTGDLQVHLITGSVLVSRIENDLSVFKSSGRRTTYYNGLCRLFGELKGMYDLVIVDMSPAIDSYNFSIISQCDRLITPIGQDMYSIFSMSLLEPLLFRSFHKFKIKIPEMRGFFFGRTVVGHGRIGTRESNDMLAHRDKVIKAINESLDSIPDGSYKTELSKAWSTSYLGYMEEMKGEILRVKYNCPLIVDKLALDMNGYFSGETSLHALALRTGKPATYSVILSRTRLAYVIQLLQVAGRILS